MSRRRYGRRKRSRVNAEYEWSRLVAGASADTQVESASLAYKAYQEAMDDAQRHHLQCGVALNAAHSACPRGQWKRTYEKYGFSPEQERKLRLRATVPDWQKTQELKGRIAGKRYAEAVYLATPACQSDKDQEAIERFYIEAEDKSYNEGCDYEVDHIYPLRPRGYYWKEGQPLVERAFCGLHVPWNLQVLKAEENAAKSAQTDYSWIDEA